MASAVLMDKPDKKRAEEIELANPDRRKPTLIALDRRALRNARIHLAPIHYPERNGSAEVRSQ